MTASRRGGLCPLFWLIADRNRDTESRKSWQRAAALADSTSQKVTEQVITDDSEVLCDVREDPGERANFERRMVRACYVMVT